MDKLKDDDIMTDSIMITRMWAKINEIVEWINDYEKLERDEENPDYHIRGRSIK